MDSTALRVDSRRPSAPEGIPPVRGSGWLNGLAAACAVLLVAWFYLWTVRPEATASPLLSSDGSDYYNLLVRGFLKGHLYLDKAADPFLATLRNPWDPAQNVGHGLHDASYFEGRYYLYFGVTPAVILFLPVRLATGLDLNQSVASLIFAWAGLLASAWIVFSAARRSFPGTPRWALVVAVTALGTTDMMALLLRRTSIWEVPITCAYACVMAGFAFLYAALHSTRRCLFLGLSSASIGLAVGARPTCLFACAILLVPLVHWIRTEGDWRAALRSPFCRRALVAAVGPACAIGLALAAYNFARFGSVAEFGQHYQLGGADITNVPLFSSKYLPYSLRVYWLLPGTWLPYFPFVSVAALPPTPVGHLGVEDPYGLLTNAPFCLFAIVPLVFARRWKRDGRRGLSAFCGAVLLASGAAALTVACFVGITNRYLVDFAPGFDLAAAIGFLALVSAAPPGSAARVAAAAMGAAAFIYSTAFNVFASFRHNELLRVEHPALYQRMVHSWNRIPFVFDHMFNRSGYGDIEMTVIFPGGASGNEPLVVTGNSFLGDYLVVNYQPGGAIAFGMEHTSHGAVFGKLVTPKPGIPHVVVVRMASIYPPDGHPFFDSMDKVQEWLIQNRVRVTLDGTVVLDAATKFYDAAHWQPSIGRSDLGIAYGRPFSGRILSWRRVPVPPRGKDEGNAENGPARISVLFPAFGGVRRDPIICSGRRGRGDLVYVQYLAPGKVAIGFDHWGYGGPVTGPLDADPMQPHTLVVDYPALDGQTMPDGSDPAGISGRLTVSLDGRKVIDADQRTFASDAREVNVGDNSIDSSMADDRFTGTLIEVERIGRR
jgi:hypothetical protein